MTALLASVRNAEEAALAAAAGADWLDLKEPAAGALGAVPLEVAGTVATRWSARLPVSATLGDCWDTPEGMPARAAALAGCGVPWVKAGLHARLLDARFTDALARTAAVVPGLIAVCFAEDPPTADQIATLARLGLRGIMLDTAEKAGGSLTARLGTAAIAGFVAAGRRHGLRVGLAGSLTRADVAPLAALGPDYLGFRGALCANGRAGTLDPARVRALRDAITHATQPAARTA